MHIRMQVRGSDKKRPQLAATCCMSSTRTTVTATLIRMPVRIRRKATEQGEKYHPAPPFHPYTHPALPNGRPKRGTTTHAERDPGVQSDGVCMVVCCTRWDGTNGGPGRSFAEPSSYYYARTAASWRARRRFWRGIVTVLSFSLFLFSGLHFPSRWINQRPPSPCAQL